MEALLHKELLHGGTARTWTHSPPGVFFPFLAPFPILAVGTADDIRCVPSSALVCCANMYGARSYAAIAQWAEEQLRAEPADRKNQSIDKALVVSLVVENPLGWRASPLHVT